MLNITIPADFQAERRYAIDLIFDHRLGVPFQLEESAQNEYTIRLGTNVVHICDCFFSKFKADESYLAAANIPQKIHTYSGAFTVQKNLPVLFGDPVIDVQEDNQLICRIDIFATVFFMLTRWEEHVLTTRDEHDRFPLGAALAKKFDFLQRPIVDEYVDMVWQFLNYLGYSGTRRTSQFEPVLTHDIDALTAPEASIRSLAGDLVKRFNPRLFYQRLKSGWGDVPLRAIDVLMDKSEELGVQSRFYLMSARPVINDCEFYLKKKSFSIMLQKITERGHLIGFHPGYNTFKNWELWSREKKLLEDTANIAVNEGRQHYLRFSVPATWQIWAENQMEIDSTLGYAEEAGFRCGTCHEFPVFDILERRVLKLKERPLIIMDVTLFNYQKLSVSSALETSQKLADQCHRVGGKLVLLWHNTSFGSLHWHPYETYYPRIIDYLRELRSSR